MRSFASACSLLGAILAVSVASFAASRGDVAVHWAFLAIAGAFLVGGVGLMWGRR
jgi:hypothetical protein